MAVALLGFGIDVVVLTSMAPTVDESSHVSYGAAILRGKPDRRLPKYDSKMPVSALNAFPRGVGILLRDHNIAPQLSHVLLDVRTPRYATVMSAFVLCLLIYLYTESLFGRAAGLFTQLIFILDPNVTAHSTLSTTDLYIALATALFLYCLRRFLLSPGIKTALLAALSLSVAQLTKFTAAYLYIVLVIALLATAFSNRTTRFPIRYLTVLALLTVICFVAVLNIGFLFDRVFTRCDRYQFRSETFQRLQRLPVLHAAPVPVPYPYLQGFDWMSYNNATGLSYGNIVLLGEVRGRELSRSDGFPSYFAVAYILKEPIGLQFLLLFAFGCLIRGWRRRDFLASEGLLLITGVVFLVMLSFFSKTQIGIRHALPVIIVLTILTGATFRNWENYNSRRKILLVACLLYAAISVSTYFPNMIPYFNEIVADRKTAYRYLADSNLDWEQDTWIVERFLKSNPDIILNPRQRVAGRVLVSANLVAGVWPRKADYFVRLERLKPVAHVGYGHLLFSVPERK